MSRIKAVGFQPLTITVIDGETWMKQRPTSEPTSTPTYMEQVGVGFRRGLSSLPEPVDAGYGLSLLAQMVFWPCMLGLCIAWFMKSSGKKPKR